MTAQPSGPSLDRSGEPWVGEFPTLGVVRVYADGSVEVDVEPDLGESPEDPVLREAALRHGWGEPLSLVRQGYRCAWGTAMVSPTGNGCLILQGHLHEVALVLLELVEIGWTVLSDRIVPTTWTDGELLAVPRAAPLLVSRHRADRAGLDGAEVRAHTDAVAVDVPRAQAPAPVLAVVEVGLRRTDETVVEEITGHERFSAASSVMAGGVLACVDESLAGTARHETMREHVALAALSFVRLWFNRDSVGADVAELCRWWSTAVLPEPERAT